MEEAEGSVAASSTWAEGMGVKAAPTRCTGANSSPKSPSAMVAATSAPGPANVGRVVRHDRPLRLAHRLEDPVGIERHQRPEVEHLDIDALAVQLIGRRQRIEDAASVGDDGDVVALALHVGLAERDRRTRIVRHEPACTVREDGLHEHAGIRVEDGRGEKPFGVAGRARHDDLESRDVHEPCLQGLRVRRTRPETTEHRRANGDRAAWCDRPT